MVSFEWDTVVWITVVIISAILVIVLLWDFWRQAGWPSPGPDTITWCKSLFEGDPTWTPAPYIHCVDSNAKAVTQSHVAVITLTDF